MAKPESHPSHVAPIPSDSDEDMTAGKSKRDDREEGASPPKSRKAETGSGAVSESLLRSLLAETTATILQNHTEQIQSAAAQLERKNESRFQKVEKKLDDQGIRQDIRDQALRDLQSRLTRVEEGSTVAPSSSDHGGVSAARRKLTLIIGGFERDTKKAMILGAVNRLIEKLGVKDQLDEDPFVTGPRRSTALLPFRVRTGETYSDARSRMHGVLGTIVQARERLRVAMYPIGPGFPSHLPRGK